MAPFKTILPKYRHFFVFLVLLCLTSPYLLQSQTASFGSKLRYGGGLGLSFGRDAYSVNLSPSAIYPASEQIAIGLGISFSSSKFGDDKLLAYGGSLISLFNPIPQLQTSLEFEQLRVRFDYNNDGFREKYWLPALYAGLGYRSGNVTVGVRYDLLFNENRSLYADPWAPFLRFYF